MGTTNRLAVHRQDPAPLAGRHPVRPGCLGKLGLDPGPHCGVDRVRVEIGQNPADGAGVWHDRADAEGVEDGAAGVVGVLGDRGE